MAVRTIHECDVCKDVIQVAEGAHPARLHVSAPTPAGIAPQPEESILCGPCWTRLVAQFPRFKETERFTGGLVKETAEQASVNEEAEQLLVLLARKLGVQVVRS